MRLLPKMQRKLLLGVIGMVIVLVAPSVISIPVVPALYGRFGYHPKQNAREWAILEVSYVGASLCKDCHAEKHGEWRASSHRTVNCETCHGPAQAHLQEGAPLSTTSSNALCELCHAEILGRPSDFAQVNPEEHAGPSPCIQCHNPHSPAVAKPPAVPHPLEGRSNCPACHGLKGWKPFPRDHAGRASETCLNCHSPG